jgi:putative ABC transport system permease protein
MNWIALKMLTADRARYLAILAGVAFATLLIAQQASIGCGYLLRTTAHIQDVNDADIWVLDRNVETIDELKPLSDSDLYRVQGVPGVAWAVRFYRGQGRLKLGNGFSQQVFLLGVDDATLVGAPREMVLGSLADLRRPDAVIIDLNGYRYLWPNEPLRLGRVLEMNDHRAVVVGICNASINYQILPVFYTRYRQAVQYVPQERRVTSAVLVTAEPGVPLEELCRRIESRMGQQALTRQQFAWKTASQYIRGTCIMPLLGTTVALGFFVGCAIAGQTFYSFTLENLPQFGSLKAMGASNRRLVGMVLVQGWLVGAIGYGLGMGLTAVCGEIVTSHSQLAFYMPWQVMAWTAAAMALIVTGASLLSIRRVLVLEPAIVFRGEGQCS